MLVLITEVEEAWSMEQKLHQVVRDQQHEAQSVKAVWAGHREGQQSNDSNEGMIKKKSHLQIAPT